MRAHTYLSYHSQNQKQDLVIDQSLMKPFDRIAGATFLKVIFLLKIQQLHRYYIRAYVHQFNLQTAPLGAIHTTWAGSANCADLWMLRSCLMYCWGLTKSQNYTRNFFLLKQLLTMKIAFCKSCQNYQGISCGCFLGWPVSYEVARHAWASQLGLLGLQFSDLDHMRSFYVGTWCWQNIQTWTYETTRLLRQVGIYSSFFILRALFTTYEFAQFHTKFCVNSNAVQIKNTQIEWADLV